jgi:hypothetical protein
MTPTTDSAVSPVREVFAVLMNGNWSIATKALAGSYGLEPSDADVWCEQGTTALIGLVGKEDASIALSRRSLDTADGVALSALKAADALLTAEAENRGDFDEDYEANVGPALAKVRSAITALASRPSRNAEVGESIDHHAYRVAHIAPPLAITEPEREPVEWRWSEQDGDTGGITDREDIAEYAKVQGWEVEPLYLASRTHNTETVVKARHADDCPWDKTRLTLTRHCTCGVERGEAEPAGYVSSTTMAYLTGHVAHVACSIYAEPASIHTIPLYASPPSPAEVTEEMVQTFGAAFWGEHWCDTEEDRQQIRRALTALQLNKKG